MLHGAQLARHHGGRCRLHREAVTLIAEVAAELGGNGKVLSQSCAHAAQRLKLLIDEANVIANGENVPQRPDSESAGDVGGQAAIDALFGRS